MPKSIISSMTNAMRHGIALSATNAAQLQLSETQPFLDSRSPMIVANNQSKRSTFIESWLAADLFPKRKRRKIRIAERKKPTNGERTVQAPGKIVDERARPSVVSPQSECLEESSKSKKKLNTKPLASTKRMTAEVRLEMLGPEATDVVYDSSSDEEDDDVFLARIRRIVAKASLKQAQEIIEMKQVQQIIEMKEAQETIETCNEEASYAKPAKYWESQKGTVQNSNDLMNSTTFMNSNDSIGDNISREFHTAKSLQPEILEEQAVDALENVDDPHVSQEEESQSPGEEESQSPGEEESRSPGEEQSQSPEEESQSPEEEESQSSAEAESQTSGEEEYQSSANEEAITEKDIDIISIHDSTVDHEIISVHDSSDDESALSKAESNTNLQIITKSKELCQSQSKDVKDNSRCRDDTQIRNSQILAYSQTDDNNESVSNVGSDKRSGSPTLSSSESTFSPPVFISFEAIASATTLSEPLPTVTPESSEVAQPPSVKAKEPQEKPLASFKRCKARVHRTKRASNCYCWKDMETMFERAFRRNVGKTLHEFEKSSTNRRANNQVDKNDTDYQAKAFYGRLLWRATDKIFQDILNLTSNDIFVDFGHGVGNAVLQAAYTFGCNARGIEVVKNRNDVAVRARHGLDTIRRDHMRKGHCVPIGTVEFLHGRLEDPEKREFLIQPPPSYVEREDGEPHGATKSFVNNYNDVFGTRASKNGQTVNLDMYVAGLFALMCPGSIMVTMHPLHMGAPCSVVNNNRKDFGLSHGSPNASFYEVERIGIGEAREVATWSEAGGNKKQIYVWKYTRLQQDTEEAVFQCSNPNCPYGVSGNPIKATVEQEVKNCSQKSITLKLCCDNVLCQGSSATRNLRSQCN